LNVKHVLDSLNLNQISLDLANHYHREGPDRTQYRPQSTLKAQLVKHLLHIISDRRLALRLPLTSCKKILNIKLDSSHMMKGNIEYDTAETGLRAVLKDYQELALRAIWATPEGLGSKAVWDRVNAELKPNTISRASVINFLEAMREMGVLNGDDITGKGGHRWIYRPAMTEAEFKQYIARTILESLMRDFPEETAEAVKKI